MFGFRSNGLAANFGQIPACFESERAIGPFALLWLSATSATTGIEPRTESWRKLTPTVIAFVLSALSATTKNKEEKHSVGAIWACLARAELSRARGKKSWHLGQTGLTADFALFVRDDRLLRHHPR